MGPDVVCDDWDEPPPECGCAGGVYEVVVCGDAGVVDVRFGVVEMEVDVVEAAGDVAGVDAAGRGGGPAIRTAGRTGTPS